MDRDLSYKRMVRGCLFEIVLANLLGGGYGRKLPSSFVCREREARTEKFFLKRVVF